MEGDRGAGTQENRGPEGYGRREEKGQEAGFPKSREPGQKEKKFTILRKIYNGNRTKRREPLRNRGRGWEAGVKGMGGGSFSPLCRPPLPYSKPAFNQVNTVFTLRVKRSTKPIQTLWLMLGVTKVTHHTSILPPRHW